MNERVIFLVGTSCAGKTSLIQNYILKYKNYKYISADIIFYKLVEENPRAPYKDIKKLVQNRFAKEINKLDGGVIIDDISTKIKKDINSKVYTILLYAPLRILSKNAKSRSDRRPLDGVLKNFSDLYIATNIRTDRSLDKINSKEIKEFLDSDRTLTKFTKEKTLKSVLRKMKIKDTNNYYIEPREEYDKIIKANKNQTKIYDDIKDLL